MSFLRPEFFWLAPLVLLPVLIHLLNRIRYRRVRWAAIEFLLRTERRAVRRARLRQLLLMALRTLVLAAALGALLEPVLRGRLASLLGSSTQVAVVVDASASMSAEDELLGSAFERAKELAGEGIASLPQGARVVSAWFAQRYESPFKEPLQNHEVAAVVIEEAQLTGGAGDVPLALRKAAESLEHGGGGGAIWLLTDLRAADWRADDEGAWADVRRALDDAGSPSIVITDVAPPVRKNLSIASVTVQPEILIKDGTAVLTVTVAYRGEGGADTDVQVFLEDDAPLRKAVSFAKADSPEETAIEKKEVRSFNLPRLTRDVHQGRVELSAADDQPCDDRYYFILDTRSRVPVLLVDGKGTGATKGAAQFVRLALDPSERGMSQQWEFAVKAVGVDDLAVASLADYKAIFLVGVPELAAKTVGELREYVASGGLVMIFPGAQTDIAAWNESGFPALKLASEHNPGDGSVLKVHLTSSRDPATDELHEATLERLLVSRHYSFEPTEANVVLLEMENGAPFLTRLSQGKGRVYVFAVSAGFDFSTLPKTRAFVVSVNEAVNGQVEEGIRELGREAFAELRFPASASPRYVMRPDGVAEKLEAAADAEGVATFGRTELAGMYRLAEGKGDAVPEAGDGELVAALNVPVQESALERIDEKTVVRTLLRGHSVSFVPAGEGSGHLTGEAGQRSAALSFPLSAAAMACLAAAVVLAWSMTRSRPADEGESQAGNRKSEIGNRKSQI